MSDLSKVVVGDLLAVYDNTTLILITPVERVTKTMVVTNHYRFKMDGYVSGYTRYSTVCANPVTEKDFIVMRIKKARRGLVSFDVTAENLSTVEEFLELK